MPLKFLWNDFVAILLFSCSDFNCWAFLGLVPWGLSYYFLAHFLKPFKGWLKILAHRGETQTQRDKNTIAKNTHVRERTVLMWVFRFLLTMLLKLIEVSVSKVFGVLFNKLFARYLCGGFGFVKLLRMTSVFLQVCYGGLNCVIKFQKYTNDALWLATNFYLFWHKIFAKVKYFTYKIFSFYSVWLCT